MSEEKELTNKQKIEHYDKVIKSYYDLIETYEKATAKMRDECNPKLADTNIENYLQMIARLRQDIVRLREERASYFS